jgi:hypothetical protein
MTKKTPRWHLLYRLPLAAAMAASLSTPVNAFQFNVGSIDGSFDTTLSAGASWRVQAQDKNLISQGNLAPYGNNPYIGTKFGGTNPNPIVGGSSNNYDNGDLNFKKGDEFSRIVKGTSELLLNWKNYGAFVRARYWYDFILKDHQLAQDGAGNYHPLSAQGDANASGGQFLDAYVWGNYNLGNVPINIRFGRQVLSWGESTFIFNGINVINPVDLTAVHAPGAQVKDVLLPVEMLYSSIGLTENITLESYIQLKQRNVKIDDCGTYFSTADFVANGCGPVLLAGQLPDNMAYASGAYSPRLGDKNASDKNQFGMALRWYAEQLNETEFGFYYIQYNSRLPLISGVVAKDPVNGSGASKLPQYFIEYPNNIKMLGLSFNTSTESGYSVAGEYSFKKDVPIQWNAFELLYGGIAAPYSKLYQQQINNGATPSSLYGKALPGYDRFNISQLQFTVIKFYDQILGASRLTMVGEVGGTYVHNLPSLSKARYGRSGIFGVGAFSYTDANNKTTTCQDVNLNPSYCTNDGFTTPFSWGYRVRFSLNYQDVFAGVNLTPTLNLSQDIKGYSPEPGGNFVEGRKSAGLSLKAEYLNNYTATVSYTNFWGGKYNVIKDRDYVSLSVSYAF